MAIKNKKIWISLLFTALFLFIYRFGYFIQVPFVKIEYVKQLFSSGESMFGFLDVFSGGALSNFSIVALGITPYITSSIVIQLLQMDIVPVLKEWADEGEIGKEKLNQLTRYVALGLAFVQAMTLTIGISVSYNNALFGPGTPITPLTYIYLSVVMTAGTAFVLWIAERITQKGVGNGTSMIIVAGIIASFPDMINDLIQTYIISGGEKIGNIFIFFGVIILMIVIIIGVIFMETAQRKIPIQYANRPATASFRGKSDSNVPIKLNSANVIPVIFASTLMSLPTTISNFLSASTAKTWINNIFSTDEPIGFVLYIVLIFVFSFFYAFLQMDPEKMSENLQKQNAYIPGIRPGDETASYISRVLFKITMVGATYLAFVAALPIVISNIFDLPSSVRVGGTSLIIVVGVAIETAKQIKTQSQEKQYRGFID
ncbi:MAG: preprotein translocase subunit SecY [Bacilli bacterium]|nr:preprotein translocase subunit SecY [Bacilli bacterium]